MMTKEMMIEQQPMAASVSCSTLALGQVSRMLCQERKRNKELESELGRERETSEALKVELGLYKNDTAIASTKQKSDYKAICTKVQMQDAKLKGYRARMAELEKENKQVKQSLKVSKETRQRQVASVKLQQVQDNYISRKAMQRFNNSNA